MTYSNATATSGTAPVTAGYNGGVTVTTASTTNMVKTGFTFTGWNTAQDLTGTSYTPGQTFVMPEAAVTLYPIWRGTINYNVNGGSGAGSVTTQTFNFGSNATLATVGTLLRYNYSFLGWSTSAVASGYTEGGGSFSTSAITTSPVILYAVWGRTLSFSTNGATIGAAPSNRIHIDGGTGVDLTTLGTDLKKRGYDFAGWSTSSAGAPLASPYIPTTATQTVYASWTAQPTKRTFYVNFKSKKSTLSAEEQLELTEFAKTFDPTAQFAKSKIQIFVGSIRYRTESAKLGTARINAITKFLKAQGVNAKFLWSNDTRSSGKISDANNNRAKVISTWVN